MGGQKTAKITKRGAGALLALGKAYADILRRGDSRRPFLKSRHGEMKAALDLCQKWGDRIEAARDAVRAAGVACPASWIAIRCAPEVQTTDEELRTIVPNREDLRAICRAIRTAARSVG